MSTPGSFELHRTPWMRLFGGPFFQPAFVVFTVLGVLFGATIQPLFLIVPAIALALWLFGATAFVRVDESGIHRRCYVSHTDAWSDIERVELYTMGLGINQASRMIKIHTGGRSHWLAPATGNGRYTERFGRDLLAAARAHGVQATGSGWGGFED